MRACKPCIYFLSNYTTSVIFRIIKKAKVFKFDVSLSLIKRGDFFRVNMNNFTFQMLKNSKLLPVLHIKKIIIWYQNAPYVY
jgi:hypothetical protein